MDKLKRAAMYVCVIMIAVQISVPIYLIVTNEITLAQGSLFKFRVAPADPYDPFRGRYVTVRLQDDEVASDVLWNEGDRAFASMDTRDGYAVITALTAEKPDTPDFIEVQIAYCSENTATVKYPFDRIFMNEKIAPLVDSAFFSFEGTVYLTVAVKDGKATVKKLLFDDTEAEKYVEQKKEAETAREEPPEDTNN